MTGTTCPPAVGLRGGVRQLGEPFTERAGSSARRDKVSWAWPSFGGRVTVKVMAVARRSPRQWPGALPSSVGGRLAIGLVGLLLLLSALWLGVQFVGGGGGTPTLTLGEGDSGTAVTVDRGTQLVVRLSANPSTGYGWVATVSDPSVLTRSGDPVFKPSSGALGADGVYTLRYLAGKSGRSELKLDYLRSWETAAPLRTVDIEVVVR